MSDNNVPQRDTGVPGLAFIVGGLVVAAIIAYFLFSGGHLSSNKPTPAQNGVNVEVNNPPSQATPAPASEPAPAVPPAAAPSEAPPPPSSEPPPQ